ncbi:mucin-17 isoform X2 [Sitodiplosis mosellana]|uniref:mucin-17 isoform X2 n=1 Tax=Sitodiplosis mosellana TaxID=263140 RepID=UPI00244509F8|nr:mucin-17 isoform X2 [Sitodiplosis mosellana]
MCDQTEIEYVDGDIVWVKFHNFWWPGEVHGESKLPPGLLKSFRKMPVAVVKFFQEPAYEYVKTINDIYRYNCNRKHEFIKKGLDLHRSKKRNMEKFPEDVRIAEEKTGGDPDIIDSEEFQPEQKPNIANIFGDQTPKMKKGVGRGRRKATPSIDEDLTYSRTKNFSLKAAHTTPTLSTPKSYTSSSLTSHRSPASASTSTASTSDFRCYLCNFSTTRLNVIVLHNKTHAPETKVEPQPAAKTKKTPVTTPVRKSPAKPRGRKPKQTTVEPVAVEIDLDSVSEDRLTQTSDSESDVKMVTPKKTVKPTPRKRQPKKSAAQAVNTENIESEVKEIVTETLTVTETTATKSPVPKAASTRKTPRATRKKQVVEVIVTETEKLPEEPIEIKSKLLADWSEEDDDSMVSTSKDVTSEPDDIKSPVSSPTHQSGDEKQPKLAIRNIPKKDRRGIILDEFYTKPVPSTNEQTQKDETVIIESDEEICEITDDLPKEPEIDSTTEEKSNSPDVVPIEIDEFDDVDDVVETTANEVVESTTDVQCVEETPGEVAKKDDDGKEEKDFDLLKQSADLLEETSLLQKDIETVGIIEKKRRLLNKHKTDDEMDSSDNARSSSAEEIVDEPKVQPVEITSVELEEEKKDEVKPKGRRKTQMVTKTYKSNARRKTTSTSGDEKGQLQSNETEKNVIKGNGTEENLADIAEDVEMKPVVESTIELIDQNDIEAEVKSEVKMETDETSPTKSDSDPSKIEMDCFDFKEEEDEVPQTLNRRKRRCLPPGKVFELQTIDKLEEMRKQEEEKAKRLKLEPDDKETIIANVSLDDAKNTSMDECTTPEKQQKDDDVKDSKALPPKERGKRIFKSRNRSRLSEGDSFSDEKSPTKEANQSFDSIEKSLADSTNESPKTAEVVPVKSEVESVANESLAKEEINSTVKLEESQIESEVANTLITLTNSPVKITESIVTSSEKDASSTDDVQMEQHTDTDTDTDKDTKGSPTETTAEVPTSSKITNPIEEVIAFEVEEQIEESAPLINAPIVKKRKSVNEKEETSSDNSLVTNVIQPLKKAKTLIVVETTTQNVNKRVNVAESSSQIRDAGDGLLIKPNPNPIPSPSQTVVVPKPVPSEVSAVSSTSSSPQQAQKKNQRTSRKKVAVTIGYDLQGNPIITYRKPSDKPVVHLPSHIQTPDMVQSVNPALLHTAKSNASSTQFVITSKGALLKTTSTTIVSQTPTTSIPARPLTQVVRSSASTSYSPQIKSPPMPTYHVQTQQSINPHLIHKQPSMLHKSPHQQMQKHPFLQHQMKAGQVQPKITTNIMQHVQPTVQKQTVKATSRPNKKQQELLIRKQQESVIAAHSLSDDSHSTEVLPNAEDNQLLAVPAENFDGPAGAFYLCRITENNLYIPIDNQPLYLDEKNQLIPGSLISNAGGIQEELVEETLVPQVSQQFEYQQEQVVQNVEEPSNLKYLLNVDGQQILLDQQSLLQLTSGGEMQQLVTADGQRLILQGSPQDILAAIQSNQQEQIIIPEDMIEEDPNHDILAAALEDTGVFPQEQYIGDVLQIQTGNGIEVDPLAFQTINQAPTSETNSILPPIMSTLEQPSKTDLTSPSVDCSNLDESLAVIGVSVTSKNVPTSLELPITVTNPAIASKTTTSAITTIYPSNVPTTLTPHALHATQMSPIVSDILHSAPLTNSGLTKSSTICSSLGVVNSVGDAVLIQEDENCEIVPNTPESATVRRVDGKR